MNYSSTRCELKEDNFQNLYKKNHIMKVLDLDSKNICSNFEKDEIF